MDIKTLLDNLHEEVSCSVCKNTFNDPKQLPCLHSFCLKCLTGVQRTSGRHDIITCPECRRESKVPGGGNLKELPTNFRINSLLDVLAIKECNTTGVKCGNCDKSSVHSFYCFQCCAFWCDECITGHNIIRANKEHRVLALKDFEDQDIENVLKRPAFCRRPGHEKKELEFFCKNCEDTICSSCVATTHDGHVKILLEEAANERKLEVISAIESRKAKAQKMRNNISKLDESCDEIQAQAVNVKRSAQQFAESMIAIIEAEKQEIFNEVEHKAKESLELLRLQRSEIENKVKTIDTEVAKSETLLKRRTNAELVQLDKSLNTIFQEGVGDEREKVDCDLEGLRQFIFEENETLKTKTIAEGIGLFTTFLSNNKAHQSIAEGKGISEATVGLAANFVLTTRNAEGEQCYEKRDCVTVEIKNHQGHDCVTEVRVQDNKDGSYKISYFAKGAEKCRLSVKVNGEHIRDSPFAVEVKPRQFRPVLSFGREGSSAGMLSSPWGVAVNEHNEIAVTDKDNHRVQVFSSDGTYLRSFGRKGDEQGEFNNPTGIAFNGNGNIIVSDASNSRVQILGDQGEHLNQFGGRGNLDHQLNAPHGLSVDNDGNIIVADRLNKLIKICFSAGQYLRKVGSVGSFTSPFHCVQHDKYLIVSDREEHCIKVFNLTDGDFLYKFGKKGEGEGEFNGPGCLSVNKAGQLMVCDTGNHRVQVFELSGKFVTKFGLRGKGIGEFNRPVSTAVFSDGRIVVTDFNNHRIQIFE